MYYLGIDGGGTSCRARVYNEHGTALGEGRSASANLRIGLHEAWQNIIEASASAFSAAGINHSEFKNTTAGLGLAGVAQKHEQNLALSYDHPFAKLHLLTDAHAACLGAFGGQDGGVLITGTGSCGITLRNKRFRLFGGWGFPVSDHGSGAWLGLKAIRYALQARDEIIPATEFTEAVMAHFGNDPEQVVSWQDRARPWEYASFSPLVFKYAGSGHRDAEKIIYSIAAEVEQFLTAMFKQVPSICLVGGVSTPLKPWLNTNLQNKLIEPQGDAMDGALVMIKKGLGRTI